MLSVIKMEAQTKGIEPKYQRNALTDLQVKAEATEFIKTVTHVNKIHSASAKNDLSLPNFCHPDVLVTWQPSALESEKLR